MVLSPLNSDDVQQGIASYNSFAVLPTTLQLTACIEANISCNCPCFMSFLLLSDATYQADLSFE